MSITIAGSFPPPRSRATLPLLVARDGSEGHDYRRRLTRPHALIRDLGDAVHLLCVLHGRLPGLVDLAATRQVADLAPGWLAEAVAGFAEERAYLTRLVVAAGPLPSTPGQAESEAAVLGQRHALEMLAQSERRGCALGAAVALVCDWTAIRAVLDMAARRFGLEPTPHALPAEAATRAVADGLAQTGGLERAFAFGAQQLLIQHHGLWALLEARRAARA